MRLENHNAVDAVSHAAIEIRGGSASYDGVLDVIGNARFVLLGEATHGTSEFYRARADITMRLIRQKGFHAVAVEADWPDAYRVNRFVRGTGADATARGALGGFERFPRWMWRNTEVESFIGELRTHNAELPMTERVGFYGLDLYSLFASIAAVVEYLDKVDPEAAARARDRYSCFERFQDDPQKYGYATSFGLREDCRAEAVAQLREMQSRAAGMVKRDGMAAADERFFAEQNARLAISAEAYYRAMFEDHVSSWNLRDRHMAQTLDSLSNFLSSRVARPKVVVWEQNSHIGDARATQLGLYGELNVGQLARLRHGNDAVLIGFSTYTGTVAAAREWDGPVARRRVVPGIRGSVEALLHETGLARMAVPLWDARAREALVEPILHRAIGVVYKPESERSSHYFWTRLADQYDAVVHFDVTSAVTPLDPPDDWEEEADAPETYPTGL